MRIKAILKKLEKVNEHIPQSREVIYIAGAISGTNDYMERFKNAENVSSNGREARKGQRMTRHKFIKIMQSKGMQRNEAVALAKKIRKNKSRGYNYENVSKGSVTIYGGGNYIVLLPSHEAIIIGKYLTDKLNYIKMGNKTFRLTKGESK